MTRVKKIMLGSLVSGLLVLSGTFQWLLHSASGAAWLWHKVEDLSAGAMQSTTIDGDLGSGVRIRGFSYRTDTDEVSVEQLDLQAAAGWWPLSIQVQTLRLHEVEISNHPAQAALIDEGGKTDIRSILTSLSLPLPLIIHDAVISDISYRLDDGAASKIAESLSFQATLGEQLQLERLQFQTSEITAGLQGRLELEAPFELDVSVNGQFQTDGKAEQLFPFELKVSGDLDELQFSLASVENGLRLNGELHDPVNELNWDVNAELDQLQWPINDEHDLLVLSALTLTSQGQVKLDSGRWIEGIGMILMDNQPSR